VRVYIDIDRAFFSKTKKKKESKQSAAAPVSHFFVSFLSLWSSSLSEGLSCSIFLSFVVVDVVVVVLLVATRT
jgi:type III secretory pathway component EscR